MIRADEAGDALLLGSVARQPLAKGVPIARSAIVQPGDHGFLAAVLTPGKRAIAMAVSDTSSVGGHVLPGDRVDIIMTYSVSGDDAQARGTCGQAKRCSPACASLRSIASSKAPSARRASARRSRSKSPPGRPRLSPLPADLEICRWCSIPCVLRMTRTTHRTLPCRLPGRWKPFRPPCCDPRKSQTRHHSDAEKQYQPHIRLRNFIVA